MLNVATAWMVASLVVSTCATSYTVVTGLELDPGS